jgi:class 3 adenylate cyclase/tetratricopeptide (TPR) repeat protein
VITQIRSPVMVGRDRELALLEEALLSSMRGDARIVVLGGEAGVGKSRLTAELLRRAVSFGCVTLVGECSETDLSLPYLPFVEAIGNRMAGDEAAKLRDSLGSAAAPLSRLFPQLASPDWRFDPTETAFDKVRLFEAMVALVRALTRSHGLLIVIEDVHWADQASQELLDYLTRRLHATSTMLLVTHRAVEMDRRHPLLPTFERWRKSGWSETLLLRPLGLDGVRAMIGAILDSGTASDALAREVHERAEGVPFAVEELLHDAVERGRTGGSEAGGAHQPPQHGAPPRTLADNILLRAERLPPEPAYVVRCASVLGRAFDFRTLVHVSGRTDEAVLDALDACVAAQLIEEDPNRDDGYRFRHALVCDAIYDDMIVSRRRLLHAKAADALRSMRDEEPAEIARHLIAAGQWEEAGPACAAAGEVAMRRLAPAEACDLFDRAVAHTVDPGERARLQCRLGEAWHQAGDVASAQRHLETGVEALEAIGDAATAAHYRLSLGRCCWERSRYAQAREHYERARDVLEAAGASEDLANAYIRLSGLHSFALDAETAQSLAERAVEIAAAAGSAEAELTARDWLGLALCDQGRLDDGLAELLRSAADAGARRMHTLEARIVSHALSVLESYGRVAEAEPLLERLRRLPRDPWTQVVALYYEGWTLLWSANLRDAARTATECIDLAIRFGMETQASWGRGLLCAVATELGDLDAARGLLPERARDIERQELLEQGWAALRYQLATGDIAAARDLATELGELPWALGGTALCDTVVEALIAAGRAQDAARIFDALRVHPRATMHRGHVLRAEGRLLLSSGDPFAAVSVLQSASAVFAENGYRLEELRTSIVLAQAVAGSDAGAAQRILQATVAAAGEADAVLLVRAAIAEAQRLGMALADAPQISAKPLEHLPQPADVDAGQQVGERLVTVLFADVRGFTELSAQRAPADIADRIATLQRWTLLAVERHHGIVDKFAGDAVMATFNATGWHVDHTRHALEVAVALVESTARLGLEMGVGIAVGPAIVGRLAEGANVSVLGPATNLASRLQAAAQAGEILMSDDAYARVRDSLPPVITGVEPTTLDLKGFAHPVAVMRLGLIARG